MRTLLTLSDLTAALTALRPDAPLRLAHGAETTTSLALDVQCGALLLTACPDTPQRVTAAELLAALRGLSLPAQAPALLLFPGEAPSPFGLDAHVLTAALPQSAAPAAFLAAMSTALDAVRSGQADLVAVRLETGA